MKTLAFLSFISVLLYQPLQTPGDQVGNGTSAVGKEHSRSRHSLLTRATDYHHPAREQLRNGVVGIQRDPVLVSSVASWQGTFSVWRWPRRVVRIHRFPNRSRTPPKKWTRNACRGAIPIAIFSVGAIYFNSLTVAMLLGPNKIAASDDTVKLAAAIGSTAERSSEP